MKFNGKLAGLLTIIALCIVAYTIVASRSEAKTDIIFGGVQGAYVQSDKMTFSSGSSSAEIVVEEEPEEEWPDIEVSLPVYTLVNDSHLISSAFVPEKLGKIKGTNQQFEETALVHLEEFLQAIRDAGFSVVIAGSYRSFSYQTQLFNSKASQIAYGFGVTDYMDPKYQDAVAEARTIVAFPGSSEHQLGLAVDLMDRNYSRFVYENMNQEFYKFVDEHCAEYGFIKRYPTKKLLLTGWDEPWHYRYVGEEVAKFIMERGICYEEFYAHYDSTFTY